MVFFSGTDISELEDNAKSHNFYLSLVVNNKLETVAKVITYAESENVFDATFKAKDENGDDYVVEAKKLNFKKGITKTYDCGIDKEYPALRVSEQFKGYVDTIIKEAEEKKKVIPAFGSYAKTGTATNPYYHNSWDDWDTWGTEKPQAYVQKPVQQSLFKPYKSAFGKMKSKTKKQKATEVEKFIMYFINGGITEDQMKFEDYMIELATDLQENLLTFEVETIVPYYDEYFDEFFPRKQYDYDFYLNILNGVIDTIEENSVWYPFLEPLLRDLKIKATETVKSKL